MGSVSDLNGDGITQTGFQPASFEQGGFNSTGFQPVQGGFVDSRPAIAPKRLVICSDGTWQSSVSGLANIPSNVTRLARSIARSGKDKDGKVWQQLVYYDAGIGTGDLSQSEKDRQGGFGIGFVGNVIEAYNFIVLNYNPGDEIMCFGFSRGAYTARAVAGLITDIGVISPRDLQDFPELYAKYQKHTDSYHFRKSSIYRDWVNGVLAKEQPPKVQGGFQEPPRYDSYPHRAAPEASRVVKVVGVFDTVGSLGIPDLKWTRWNLKFLEDYTGIPDPGFHNVSLSPYIKHAFHALALDEHRGPFSPTLWHMPLEEEKHIDKPETTRDELWAQWSALHQNPEASDEQKTAAWGALVDAEMYLQLRGAKSELLQVWFPGMHINIGGGSDDLLRDRKGDFEQIALISFAWMCERVAPYLSLSDDGTLSTLASDGVGDRWKLIQPVLEEVKRGDKDYGNHWIMKRAWTALDKSGLKKAQVKSVADGVVNGWATGPIVDSFTGTMVAAGSIIRTPGQYTKDDKGRKLGPTNEMIHPSVEYRKSKVSSYRPEALLGFGFKRSRQESGNKGWAWSNGTITIPEYLIKPEDHFSRFVAMQDNNGLENQASDFIGGIDKDVGAKTSEADTLDMRASKKVRVE